MSRSEAAFNALLGISILSGSILGFVFVRDRPLFVQCVLSVLQVCVGTLVLCRTRALQNGTIGSWVASIPALIISGWVVKIAPSSWSHFTQWLFFTGGLMAIVSLLYLGRCFAILPAIRGTVTAGPYRIVRHPAYFGELVMVVACWLAAPLWATFWLLIATIGLVVVRIIAEERVMMDSDEYTKYVARVRWRLIPRVW